MFLDVAKHIVNVVVTSMVGAASVAVRSSWELHVHQWLVGKVLVLVVELRRVVRNVGRALGHQVTVGQRVLVVRDLLLYLVLQLG